LWWSGRFGFLGTARYEYENGSYEQKRNKRFFHKEKDKKYSTAGSPEEFFRFLEEFSVIV